MLGCSSCSHRGKAGRKSACGHLVKGIWRLQKFLSPPGDRTSRGGMPPVAGRLEEDCLLPDRGALEAGLLIAAVRSVRHEASGPTKIRARRRRWTMQPIARASAVTNVTVVQLQRRQPVAFAKRSGVGFSARKSSELPLSRTWVTLPCKPRYLHLHSTCLPNFKNLASAPLSQMMAA
jgi:hypothetical protein